MSTSEKQREQQSNLQTKLWDMANDLRGSMDASEFKNYILGLIFYRYLSENLQSRANKLLEEDNMSYEEYIDRYESVQKDKEETVLKYIGNIDIDRLDKDEQYRENCFAEFFRQNIGEKLDYFDKDDQELINLKSVKFSIDYHYRTEIIKEMESLEALKKVMFMMTVIADEMISNNLN